MTSETVQAKADRLITDGKVRYSESVPDGASLRG